VSAIRRVARPIAETARAAPPVPPEPLVSEEIAYKGYRVEPGSYAVSNGAWSPRVVVSLKAADGSSQRTPLYATSAARFPTREEADRRALDVARAWIDAAVERRRE